jgi:hypothetical protein
MNDVAIPLLIVLLEGNFERDIAEVDPGMLESVDLLQIESDLYWMLSRLLSDIQDNYTFSQPGIQRMCTKLKEVIENVDPELVLHLEKEHVQILQIAFRWFNCLLTREVGIRELIRIWDSCFAEPTGFSVFLIYVCAALICRLSKDLKAREFESIMVMITQPAALEFSLQETDTLLSEAFVLMSAYEGPQIGSQELSALEFNR